MTREVLVLGVQTAQRALEPSSPGSPSVWRCDRAAVPADRRRSGPCAQTGAGLGGSAPVARSRSAVGGRSG